MGFVPLIKRGGCPFSFWAASSLFPFRLSNGWGITAEEFTFSFDREADQRHLGQQPRCS